MRFFAFAALLLALPHITLGSHSDRCPCIGNHSSEKAVKTLEHNGLCPNRFGLGCNTHDINASCAVHIYESETAAQLKCGPSNSGESPWCETEWCYVDPQNCNLDFEWGVLGQAYSYATCGNLRQGTAEFFQKSLAVFLEGDSLRVFHAESTLEGGYLGNTGCSKVYKYSQNRHCEGRVAKFWEGSLDELNQSKVQIDHRVIKRVEEGIENGIDQYFIDYNLSKAFEEYKARFRELWFGRPTTNFDLCAFATGMGYADLCTGAFALTHRRQAMTYVIELYTAPLFMVSKSKCDFFASDSGKKYWGWWISIFSPEAWGFFVGVVFFFIVAMKGLDHWLEWLDTPSRPARAGAAAPASVAAAAEAGAAHASAGHPEGCLDKLPGPPPKKDEEARCMKKFRECFCCFTHGLGDALLGVCEAFVNKSKTSHRRDSNKPSRARPSHMLRLGLGFFILLSTAVYGGGVTAEMVSAKEIKGEVPSLEEASQRKIPLCTHVVYEEPLRPFQVANLTTFSKRWEDVLKNLNGKKCSAALLDDEAWNTFRSRKQLCGYHKEPTAELYVPTGAVVSKRAYRTLETFRFAASKTAFFFDKSPVLPNACPSNSPDTVCAKIKDEGVPWYTLFSLFVVAAGCGVCSLIGVAHHHFVRQDEENKETEEEKEKKTKDEEMNKANMTKIQSLLDGFGKMSKVLEEDRKKNMKDEEMNKANMAKIESLLVDLEFGQSSQVLKQSNLRPQSDAAGSNAEVQDDVESSARSTGSGSSSTTPPNKPTNICPW